MGMVTLIQCHRTALAWADVAHRTTPLQDAEEESAVAMVRQFAVNALSRDRYMVQVFNRFWMFDGVGEGTASEWSTDENARSRFQAVWSTTRTAAGSIPIAISPSSFHGSSSRCAQ